MNTEEMDDIIFIRQIEGEELLCGCLYFFWNFSAVIFLCQILSQMVGWDTL